MKVVCIGCKKKVDFLTTDKCSSCDERICYQCSNAGVKCTCPGEAVARQDRNLSVS